MTIVLSDKNVDKLARVRKSMSFVGSDEGLIEMLLSEILSKKTNTREGGIY